MLWDYYEDGFAGSLFSVSLSEDCQRLIVKGKISSVRLNEINRIAFYALPLYTDETVADYWRLPPFAAVEAPRKKEFCVEAPVGELKDIDSRNGEIFTSKVMAVIEKKNGNRQLVDHAKFLSNPEAAAANQSRMPALKSPKGVGLLIPSDLEHLHCSITSINVLLSGMLTVKNHGAAETIVYRYEEEEYYFRKSQIDMIDHVLMNCSRSGMALIAILIMHSTGVDDPQVVDRYLVHPDAHNAIDLVVPDMTNMRSTQYYKAIISFLSKRYNGISKDSPGRMYGYIVGNEIGTTHCWNCMGNKTLEQYIEGYHNWLRLTYNVVRSNDASAHVYASFDHNWNVREHQPFFISFENREVFDALVAKSRQEGDFGWDVVWHPYPQNIYKIDTWNDPDCEDHFDTKYITFKNIGVLSDYLNLPQNRYNGKPRQIALTEQGFTSTDNSEENQLLQAAAYAYAYYKVIMNGIEVFSMNGHVDNGLEMGLSLGLWSAQKGTVNKADTQKRIYDVFYRIDTVDSLSVTRFALDVIGKTMNRKLDSWKDIIPEFDERILKEKCFRPAVEEAEIRSGLPQSDSKALLESGCFSAGNDTENLRLIYDGTQNTPTACADVFSSMYAPDVPKDYKGLTFVPYAPLDLSDTPVLGVRVRVTQLPESSPARYLLRVFSGDTVLETGEVCAPCGEWCELSVDLTTFSGLQAVDKIEIWMRPEKDTAVLSGTLCACGLRAYQQENSFS